MYLDKEHLYEQAYSLHTEGSIEEAKELYKKIILEYPKSKEAQKARQQITIIGNNGEKTEYNEEAAIEETMSPYSYSASTISEEKPNSIARGLDLIGRLTIILGIVAAFIIIVKLQPSSYYSSRASEQAVLAWVYGIAIGVSSFVSGMVFIGFGEVINLLHNINKKMPIAE